MPLLSFFPSAGKISLFFFFGETTKKKEEALSKSSVTKMISCSRVGKSATDARLTRSLSSSSSSSQKSLLLSINIKSARYECALLRLGLRKILRILYSFFFEFCPIP